MRSIYRSKEHADIIEKLTQKNPDTGYAVFPTIKALQCFAAVLGFDQKRRKKLADRSNLENIEWHTFNNDNYTHYIYLIALAETGNLNILRYDVQNSDASSSGEDMVAIFEEYANGGFEVLRNWLGKALTDSYGDKAILIAMEKAGFLQKPEENKFDEVQF